MILKPSVNRLMCSNIQIYIVTHLTSLAVICRVLLLVWRPVFRRVSLVSGSFVRTRTGAREANTGVIMHLRAGAWLQRFDLDKSRMVCDLALWEHSASVLVIEGGRGGRGCVGERSGEEVRAITDLKPFSGIFVGTEDIFRGPQGRVTVCVMPGWLLGVILTEMMMVTSLHDEDAGRWGPRLWLSWCRPSSSAPQMSELASDGRCWSRAPRAGASVGQSQTNILASGAACTIMAGSVLAKKA